MRSPIRSIGLAIVAFGFTTAVVGQPPAASTVDAAHNTAFDDCAKSLHECQRLCDACSHHCAHMVANGKKEHVKTMMTCQDCAAFCAMTARIVSSMGPFADLAVDGCANACGRCAAACEKFNDDAQMRQCGEECRRCEKACRNLMTGHLGKTAPTAR